MLRNLEKLDLPKIEKKVLDFWKTNRIFEKSLEKRRGRKAFNFYEGPPYANGLPGVHHVLARVFKDIILRYKSMAGYYVPRRAGWDTHGLPIELAAEKELGITSKKQVEEFGIDKFNQKAKETAFRFKREFEKMTERIGYWLDLKNAYITCSNEYIEKLWGVMKKISRRGFFKKDYKILPWCPRCETPLASHELGQPEVYRLTSDPSLYLKVPLRDEEKTYFLVWTTTPWTLPANVFVAVNPELEYKKFRVGQEFIWSHITPPGLGENAEFEEKVLGSKLVGKKYLAPYAREGKGDEKKYLAVEADFVSAEEGTGLVHIAPAFGEDDLKLVKKIGLKDFPTTVNDSGEVIGSYPGEGLSVKEADKQIIADLEKRGLVFELGKIEHEYPHCWRCGTPLIYFARNSWFIEVSRVRAKMVKANKKINWVPDYIKDGRFGGWIKEAKDWAISRERYWGTPLPIWECFSCGQRIFVGSKKEFAGLAVASGNKYFVLRHGEAESNTLGLISCFPEKIDIQLTPKGKKQIMRIIPSLKRKKIDLIFSSPIRRVKDTAEITGQGLGLAAHYDNRLIEYNVGVFNGRPIEDFYKFILSEANKFIKIPEQGESLNSVRQRMMDFVREAEEKYKNKNILLVGHGDPLWLLEGAAEGMSDEEIIKARGKYIKPGELREIRFLNLPYDESGKLDWHRPYIDKVKLECPKCRSLMSRTPEVADVWFDSGAMPFAAGFYPKHFPADYIAEALDQTRGWFYTLLAVSSLLGKGAPYKNVICLGLVLDKYGQKMSKSKGNVVDFWEIADKYGIDALRWYFYTVNDPGEPKNFDEADISKVLKEFLLIIYNVFSFYGLYAKESAGKPLKSKHLLDRWILSRLEETVRKTTLALENYDIGSAGKNIGEFTDDLSRWYVRRSRSRFQRPESSEKLAEVSLVLKETLAVLSRLLAPFLPFFSEALYLSLGHKESVHLSDWPKFDRVRVDNKLMESMAEVRTIASQALALRNSAGIKVRQPLQTLKVKSQALEGRGELLAILKEEINVKEILFDRELKEDVWLDTEITAGLKQEGLRRDFIRIVQDLRQKAGLKPGEEIAVEALVFPALENAITSSIKEIAKIVYARSIDFKDSGKSGSRIETNLEGEKITVAIRKV
jgi:isoleucyl-tRNA synthetase